MATKPALRHLLLNKTKKDFVLAISVAIVVSTSYYFGVKMQRKKTFEEFHKNYDVKAAIERMKAKGVFQNVDE